MSPYRRDMKRLPLTIDDRFVHILINYFKLNLMLFSSILLVAPVESPECFAFCLKILGGGNDLQMV